LKPEVWQRVREILDQALQLSPGDRADYLDDACTGDKELRAEVESLIASFERAGDTFLEGRAIEAPGSMETPATGRWKARELALTKLSKRSGMEAWAWFIAPSALTISTARKWRSKWFAET
jgi:hypothetical protein